MDTYFLLTMTSMTKLALQFVSVTTSKDTGLGDYEKFTIAPNYAITDSLGAIFEYSDIEDNQASSEVVRC